MKLFFDLETNGLNSNIHSVLSFSGIITNDNLEIIREINRFYYPAEGYYNSSATRINGLTKEVIDKKRKGEKYSKYFKDDKEIFWIFRAVDEIVAYNLNFDFSFVRKAFYDKFMEIEPDYNISSTCTFGKTIGKLPKGSKWPKLKESIEFWKIDTSKIDGNYHDGRFDNLCNYLIYKKLNGYEPEIVYKEIENIEIFIELSTKIRSLKNENKELKSENEKLLNKNEELENNIDTLKKFKNNIINNYENLINDILYQNKDKIKKIVKELEIEYLEELENKIEYFEKELNIKNNNDNFLLYQLGNFLEIKSEDDIPF